MSFFTFFLGVVTSSNEIKSLVIICTEKVQYRSILYIYILYYIVIYILIYTTLCTYI